VDVACTGRVYPETPAYWARDPGVMLPGDASEVEDITVRPLPDGEDPPLPAELDFGGLTQCDQDRVIDRLVDAAGEN
jgi:hypothetical protein